MSLQQPQPIFSSPPSPRGLRNPAAPPISFSLSPLSDLEPSPTAESSAPSFDVSKLLLGGLFSIVFLVSICIADRAFTMPIPSFLRSRTAENPSHPHPQQLPPPPAPPPPNRPPQPLWTRVHHAEVPRDDFCCVCLEALCDGRGIVKLGCAHVLHELCVVQWSLRSQLCPICREVFVE